MLDRARRTPNSTRLGTPTGRFTFHVIAAVAELERELIRERTRCGVAAARRRGKRVGRPPARVDVAQVRQLHAQGKSLRQIAAAVQVGIGTVQRLLAAGDPKTSPKPTLQVPAFQGCA